MGAAEKARPGGRGWRCRASAARRDWQRVPAVFQPIGDLGSGEPVGVEALTRFGIEPHWSPDRRFAVLHRVASGIELERAAVRGALGYLPAMPSGSFLMVNVGPAAVVHLGVLWTLADTDPRRVAVELTEHVPADDSPAVRKAHTSLRRGDGPLAVDDPGAGFAGLSHSVELVPASSRRTWCSSGGPAETRCVAAW